MTDTNHEWAGTFQDVEREQLRAWMRATPEQKLQWLEDALRFAHEAGALRREEPEE